MKCSTTRRHNARWSQYGWFFTSHFFRSKWLSRSPPRLLFAVIKFKNNSTHYLTLSVFQMKFRVGVLAKRTKSFYSWFPENYFMVALTLDTTVDIPNVWINCSKFLFNYIIVIRASNIKCNYKNYILTFFTVTVIVDEA